LELLALPETASPPTVFHDVLAEPELAFWLLLLFTSTLLLFLIVVSHFMVSVMVLVEPGPVVSIDDCALTAPPLKTMQPTVANVDPDNLSKVAFILLPPVITVISVIMFVYMHISDG
jgi:hypothetical protein